MFALGVVVGLSIGHALGYRHAKADDETVIFMLREEIRTVPRIPVGER